jgi:N-acetylglutamate synthase-like GNAT family acetyltransferase
MSLLSEVDRSILRTREILDSLENDYVYFVVEDMDTKMIIGTGTIIITNTSTKLSKLGYIENIMIRKDYQNIGLGNMILQRLNSYCLDVRHCIKITVNCDSNI